MKCDPGPCPVDDAPHTTCTAPGTPLALVQLPARNQPRTPRTPIVLPETPPAATASTFTTGTYRRVVVRAALTKAPTS
jgi:hypothetical protein